ncbi:hypothetical protein SNEBB_002306 [Seison nebaliae]|nr:hypothetical protein SNEBB_002306 [Seison nebaliae]
MALSPSSVIREIKKIDRKIRKQKNDSSEFQLLGKNDEEWSKFFHYYILNGTMKCDDDLLFYVKKEADGKIIKPKNDEIVEVKVFRRNTTAIPSSKDLSFNWKDTILLNIIINNMTYRLTLAICAIKQKELFVIEKKTTEVYATPSQRQMNGKGVEEKMAFPNIYFHIDDFENTFQNIRIKRDHIACVELVGEVADEDNKVHEYVLFIGSIKYEILKNIYDSKELEKSNKSSKRKEFIRMKGPNSVGFAEMAVSKPIKKMLVKGRHSMSTRPSIQFDQMKDVPQPSVMTTSLMNENVFSEPQSPYKSKMNREYERKTMFQPKYRTDSLTNWFSTGKEFGGKNFIKSIQDMAYMSLSRINSKSSVNEDGMNDDDDDENDYKYEEQLNVQLTYTTITLQTISTILFALSSRIPILNKK